MTKILILVAAIGLVAGCSQSNNQGAPGNENGPSTGTGTNTYQSGETNAASGSTATNSSSNASTNDSGGATHTVPK